MVSPQIKSITILIARQVAGSSELLGFCLRVRTREVHGNAADMIASEKTFSDSNTSAETAEASRNGAFPDHPETWY